MLDWETKKKDGIGNQFVCSRACVYGRQCDVLTLEERNLKLGWHSRVLSLGRSNNGVDGSVGTEKEAKSNHP